MLTWVSGHLPCVTQRATVTNVHTIIHALRTKNHSLISWPKNSMRDIQDPNRATDVEMPICMHSGCMTVRTSIRPSMEKAWSRKIGGNDRELVQWISHLPRYRMECVCFCVLDPKLQCCLVRARDGSRRTRHVLLDPVRTHCGHRSCMAYVVPRCLRAGCSPVAV